MSDIVIAQTALSDPALQVLIGCLNRELAALYPEDGTVHHFRLDPEEVAPGHGAVLVARVDGATVGCGAVRRIADDVAEIKRMYTKPEMRGKGVARRIVEHLEQIARQLGCRRLVLETGPRQPEAVRLYRRMGYETIPAFGEYVDSPLSLFLGKSLRA
jgi:putative acetyltransferase